LTKINLAKSFMLISLLQKATSSAEGFFEHPQFGRLCRTSDFARVLPDGSIQQIGQVATFYEIDQALLSSELVQDSVSLVMDNPVTSQQQFVAVWVPSEKARSLSHSEQLDVLAKKLRRELASKLNASAVPALLVPIDEIPTTRYFLTARAKIQRYIEQMGAESLKSFSIGLNDEAHEENLTYVEKTIAAALSAVIGIEQHNIGKHTSFYKLGLDSLSAIAFSRKLQESGFGRLPVSTILRHSSVAQLATFAPVTTNGHQSPQPLSLEQPAFMFDESFLHEVKKDINARGASVQGVYPCTPLQEAMLAAESDVDSAYFNHLLLRVNTDIERLKESWTQIVQRHGILRTCFRQTNDPRFAYAQVVLETAILPWTSVETSSDNLDTDVVRRKSDFEHQSPVNGDLPYSLTVFEDSTTHSTHLLLSIHHALYDGEGIAQLLHELQASLAGEKLPEATPFHHFIEYMVSVNSDASDQFWDRYLSDVSPTLLSAPKKPSANGSVTPTASQQIHVNLTHSLASFKRQCMDLSVTLLNVFHAAWARLLALHSGATDICFGNVFSCRTIPLEGADRIVGPCFNTLPMRVKFSSSSTNGDVMKLSQKHNSDILPHQLSALRRIQRRILSGGSRLFDTLVIFQAKSTELDARYWEMLSDEGNMGFPLICEIVPDETRDTVQICLHFQTSHLGRDVAESLARDFVALVEQTTQYPSAQACDKRVIDGDISANFEKESPRAKINGVPTKTAESRAWSSQEEILREIICNFAGVKAEAVLLHTTIFQLGLDSINAVQISGSLRKLGYKVSAGDILEVKWTSPNSFIQPTNTI
jgi:acyl carrier protein